MATEAPLPREVVGPARAETARDLRAWTGPLLLGLATVVALRLLLGGWALVVADAFPSTPAEQQAIAKQFADAGSRRRAPAGPRHGSGRTPSGTSASPWRATRPTAPRPTSRCYPC